LPVTLGGMAHNVSAWRAYRRGATIDAEDGKESRGLPISAFDAIRAGVAGTVPILQGHYASVLRVQPARRQDFGRHPGALVVARMLGGVKAHYDCIKAFSETDFTEDLKRFDVPTLILHGDDDQIVPIGAAGLMSAKIVKNAKLKVYPGFPHGCAQPTRTRSMATCLRSSGKTRKQQRKCYPAFTRTGKAGSPDQRGCPAPGNTGCSSS